MPTAPRYDYYSLRPSFETKWGALVCEGVVAKEGVLRYATPSGGIRRELVTRDHALRADSLASIAYTKVTEEHPNVPVDATNVTQFGKGTVLDEVELHNGFVKIRFVIDSADTIDKVRNDGLRELSPGYEVELLEEAGEHPVFGPYDAIQMDRLYNHTALTRQARAGHDVRFRTDSGQMPPNFAWQIREDTVWPEKDDRPYEIQTRPQETRMPQLNLDGITFDLPDVATAQAIQSWRKDQEEAAAETSAELAAAKEAVAEHQAKISELEEQIAELAKVRDELQGQLDALVKGVSGDPAPEGESVDADDLDENPELAGAPGDASDKPEEDMMNRDSFLEYYQERKELEPLAERYRVDSADKLDNDELKVKICEAFLGDDLSEVSPERVDGIYRGMKVVLDKRDGSYRPEAPARPSPAGLKPAPRQDSSPVAREKAAQANYRARLTGTKTD